MNSNPVSTQEFAMSKNAIISPELTPPVGPFSHAIEVGGFLYFSGQVGQDPATGKVVEGGIVAETERVFQNLSAVLKAAGKSFDDVVRAGVFLTSISDFAAMNGIYPFGSSLRAWWCWLPQTNAECRAPTVRQPSPRRRVVQPALSRRTCANQMMVGALL